MRGGGEWTRAQNRFKQLGRVRGVTLWQNVHQLTVCWPKTAEFMPVTFLQLYNGTEENIMFRRIMQLAKKQRPPKRRTQPKPEEDLGGGDICSLQEYPSTDDDQPLD